MLRRDLFGLVVRTTSLGDLEAESLTDIFLHTDKRSDEFCPAVMLDTAG